MLEMINVVWSEAENESGKRAGSAFSIPIEPWNFLSARELSVGGKARRSGSCDQSIHLFVIESKLIRVLYLCKLEGYAKRCLLFPKRVHLSEQVIYSCFLHKHGNRVHLFMQPVPATVYTLPVVQFHWITYQKPSAIIVFPSEKYGKRVHVSEQGTSFCISTFKWQIHFRKGSHISCSRLPQIMWPVPKRVHASGTEGIFLHNPPGPPCSSPSHSDIGCIRMSWSPKSAAGTWKHYTAK